MQPTEVISAERAPEVLERLPKLLAQYPDCDRIRIYSQDTFLFQVDCKGQPIVD